MAIKEQEDIEYIRSMVLRKFPLLGVTMSKLETVANDKIEAAATDGKRIIYSPQFFKQLSDDEKVSVYVHEVMHVAFNHIMRSKDRDYKLWNIATDSVINQILKKVEILQSPLFFNDGFKKFHHIAYGIKNMS